MSRPTVTLEVMAGPHQGERRKFESHDTLLVGRAKCAQLRLPNDLHFSRNHFRVEVKPPQCHLVDLESSNGTFVNGERVTDVWLKDGDTISGGRTEIIVRINGQMEATETVDFDQVNPAIAMTMVPETVEMPQAILQYDIQREIGRGSMGVVYHAKCFKTKREVAVKLISSAAQVGDQSIKTFLREGQILKALNHKRIVRFVEAGVFHRQLFLAMEYVPAIDLDKTLNALKFRDRIRVSCALVRQVLDGLAHAHGQDLIHRDVKPKNLLVAKRENGLNCKLADFGLAKNFMDAGLSQISGENEIKGTLCFMAPEQVVNCRYAKPPADIFSAAATLYTLISDKMIYDLDDHRTPLAAVLNSGPVPIRDRVELDPGLVAVIDKGLAPEVDDRYQTADEMRAALKPYA